MNYEHAIRVFFILAIWGIATIVAVGWSAVLLRHIKTIHTDESLLLSETVHTIVITFILIAIVIICMMFYPETLNAICEFSEGMTGLRRS